MNELSLYFSVAQAITILLHPYGEILIHDLRTGQIAAIYNNISKRKVGDESLIQDLNEYDDLPDVFPVYSKMNWDGRKMKSSSATLRDKKGKPIGLLCINLDISKWVEVQHFVDEWIGNLGNQKQNAILFKDDWKEKINTYVSEYLKSEGTSLKGLTREKKKSLIKALHKEGAFQAKHAASYVANVLNLSRATIYNYLR